MTALPLEISIIALLFVVIAAGGFVQGLTSFGFALITVPVLVLFLPIREVIPVSVILGIVTNVLILSSCFRSIHLGNTWILLLSSFAAVPLGLSALLIWPSSAIKLLVGALVVAVAILLLAGKTYSVKRKNLAYIGVGLASGFLNGSVSMSGPPVVLFLSNQGVDKQYFRANITLFGLALNVFTIGAFGLSGLVTTQVVITSLWLVPGMLIGVFLGNAAIRKLNEREFKTVALWLILVSGAGTVVGALGTLAGWY